MHFEMYAVTTNALSRASSLLFPQEWRWRLVADNGEILASGEGFTSRQACQHSINLVKSTTTFTEVREVAM